MRRSCGTGQQLGGEAGRAGQAKLVLDRMQCHGFRLVPLLGDLRRGETTRVE